jgi:hypothetical protein
VTLPDHRVPSTFYGPFHRRSAAKGQDAATAVLQALSGEVWGETPRHGATPAVQAYAGSIPDGQDGIEFWARQAPDSQFGPRPFWRIPGEHLRVELEGGREVAKLRVAFTRITQNLLSDAEDV